MNYASGLNLSPNDFVGASEPAKYNIFRRWEGGIHLIQGEKGSNLLVQIAQESSRGQVELLSDGHGFFTSLSRIFWDKPFHQLCNNCSYEWQSRGITFRCPRCKSTDISNVRS